MRNVATVEPAPVVGVVAVKPGMIAKVY